MATYNQPNEYQVMQSSLYQLPVQQIVQAIATRTAYWDAGASKLKNTYQQYLNLDLTRQDNKMELDNIMQGVNDNLKKAVGTDLSIGENTTNALKIFEPIYKNQNIMGDNAITNFYKGQLTTAESLRNKDGGKEYSDINVRDVMNQYNKFATDKSADNWREHYQNRRYYTPYYDVMAEIRDIEKDFKPDVTGDNKVPEYTKVKGPDGKEIVKATGYAVTTQDKSVRASQLRAFIDSRLSDKGRNQLNINGRVSYDNKIDDLARDYMDRNDNLIAAKNGRISDLKVEIAAEKAGKNRQEIISSYDSEMSQLENEIREHGITNAKLKVKDYSDLNLIKDQVAGFLYTDKLMDHVGQSGKRIDITRTYDEDKTAMEIYKQEMMNYRNAVDNQTDLTIAGMKKSKESGEVDANGLPIIKTDNVYINAGESNNETVGKKTIDKLAQDSDESFKKALNKFDNYVKDTFKDNLTGLSPAERDKVIDKIFSKKENQNDPMYLEWKAAIEAKNSSDAVLSAVNEYVDKNVSPKLKKNIDDIYKSITSQSIARNTNNYGGAKLLSIDSELSKQLIKGTSPGLTLREKTVYTDQYGAKTNVLQIVDRNGKEWVVDPNSQLSKAYYSNVSSVQELNKAKDQLLNSAVTKVLGIHQFSNGPKDDKNIERVQSKLESILKGAYEGITFEKESVDPYAKDDSGGAYFHFNPKKGEVDFDKVKEYVSHIGGSYDEVNNLFYIPSDKIGQNVIPSRIFADQRIKPISTFVDVMSQIKQNSTFQTPVVSFNGNPFSFSINTDSGLVTGVTLIHKNSEAKILDPTTGKPFTSLDAASAFANDLAKWPKETRVKYIQQQKPDYNEQ